MECYRKLSMEYNNLVANCDNAFGEPTCSSRKRNTFDEELFVSPLDDDCETHSMFYPNGEVHVMLIKIKLW